MVKAVSWRISASLTTVLLVYLLTGETAVALSVGLLEIVVKLALYFLHERAWERIPLGKSSAAPAVLWFTGLSGSGKTTIANALYRIMKQRGFPVERLDGDITREFLPQTGFTRQSRMAHLQKAAFIARMLEQNGIYVLVSYISPYEAARQRARELCSNLFVIYVATSLDECERRDVKGLYAKVRRGEIEHFTGVDDPYEVPEHPDLVIDTQNQTPEEASQKILRFLKI